MPDFAPISRPLFNDHGPAAEKRRRLRTAPPSVRWLSAVCGLCLCGAASAWSGDTYLNTRIATATGDPFVAGDDAGGQFVVWQDQRSDGGDIYAQRIDASGRVLWPADGIVIRASAGVQTAPAVVGDGAEGAYIAWEDLEDGEIWLQRVDGNGAVAAGWPAGGLAVTDNGETDGRPMLAPDGAGGVLIAWNRYGSNWDIYAQRIDGGGGVQTGWPAGGAVVTDAGDGQTELHVISDGNGGAIVVWQSFEGNDKLRAQRLDGSGSRLWDAGGGDFNGIGLATCDCNQSSPAIVGDGSGGALVVWRDDRVEGAGDLYGQRLDANGVLQWDAAGLPLVVADSYQRDHRMVGDGDGAFLAWIDSRTGGDEPYLQRIDGSGAAAGGWPADGIRLGTEGERAEAPTVVADGSGGVVAAWVAGEYSGATVRAQRISAAGAPQWGAAGIAISERPGYFWGTAPVANGDGGALVTWRNRVLQGDYELFAQRVYADGSLSTVTTPHAIGPAGGAVVSAGPTLTASPFEDAAALPATASQSGAQWRVLTIANPVAERPKAAAAMDDRGGSSSIQRRLPFTFPFFGRDISAVSVNQNGLIELLEEGEACVECGSAGTHANAAHVDAMDAIFASNGQLYAEDGYIMLFEGEEHVMVEWYGRTRADSGTGEPANRIHFRVLLYADGRIVWSFREMAFVSYDADMYSGVYPNGGTEVDVGYAIDTQSTYAFDPTTKTVNPITYAWHDPDDYIVYDSGESATDLAAHTAASLGDGQEYYWAVRYRSDVGDWTPWSEPGRFSVDGAAPLGTLSINGGDAATATHDVILTLGASDTRGVTGYYVSESAATPADSTGFTSVDTAETFHDEVPFTLSGGDGSKTVYVWFCDAVGNISTAASDTIVIDTATGVPDESAPPSGGGGGPFDPLFGLLLGLPFCLPKGRRSTARSGERLRGSTIGFSRVTVSPRAR